MVKRIYAEKKEGLRVEAGALLGDIRDFLGITRLTGLRILNRYDAERISDELFDYAVTTVFSEPQQDDVHTAIPSADAVFAVEFLPGQFDQRADSAAQCIQIISRGERPVVRTAKVYVLYGTITPALPPPPARQRMEGDSSYSFMRLLTSLPTFLAARSMAVLAASSAVQPIAFPNACQASRALSRSPSA